MKVIPVLFLSWLIYSDIYGQTLTNTEWVKIQASRKDGSRIIDHLQSGERSLQYYFTNDTAFSSIYNQRPLGQKYSFTNSLLSIGDFVNYRVDALTDTFLIITEIARENLPDDKVNRFAFIKRPYLFEYLRQTHQLRLTGDSLVECDQQFSPTFKGIRDTLFRGCFGPRMGNRTLMGSFVLSSQGDVKNVKLTANDQFTLEETKKIRQALEATRSLWDIPPAPATLQFKVPFSLMVTRFESFVGTQLLFPALPKQQEHILTQQEIAEASEYFNSGVRFFKKEKWEKAVGAFKACIEIDALYIDAYYNLAAAYVKLGNPAAACEYWQKLKGLGQKRGEKLYNENCK